MLEKASSLAPFSRKNFSMSQAISASVRPGVRMVGTHSMSRWFSAAERRISSISSGSLITRISSTMPSARSMVRPGETLSKKSRVTARASKPIVPRTLSLSRPLIWPGASPE